MCIKKLPETYDVSRLLDIFNSIDTKRRQIAITSITGDDLFFGTESLTSLPGVNQSDFNKLNARFKGTYLEEVVDDVNRKYNTTRVRFMNMDPGEKRAYSYHCDETPRLHIPLKTNSKCMFLVEDVVYRMPEEGALYWLDTTKIHTAMNLSWDNRIHIVFCCK